MELRSGFAAIALTLGILSGCASTSEELAADGRAAARSASFSENYQEIYRRVHAGASRCMVASAGGTRIDVEAQLYNELGYGEITQSMASVYGKSYYMTAKIERAGSGSRVTVRAKNGIGGSRAPAQVLKWASGDSSC